MTETCLIIVNRKQAEKQNKTKKTQRIEEREKKSSGGKIVGWCNEWTTPNINLTSFTQLN